MTIQAEPILQDRSRAIAPDSREPVLIRRVHTSVDLDGDLLQPAWKNAQWNSGFTLVGKPEAAAKDKTSFAMLYDAEKLYIAVKTELIHSIGFAKYYWKEDPKGEIQVLIDSERSGKRMGLFCISGDGTYWVKSIDSTNESENWPGTIQRTSKTDGNTWIIQLAVELAEFQYADSSDRQWKFNIVRLPSRNAQQLWSTFAPLPDETSFSLPQNVCGDLAFENPKSVSPYLWTLAPAGRARIVETGEGRASQQVLKVTNLLAETRTVELQARIDAGRARLLPLRFEPNQMRLETIDAPIDADFEFGHLDVALVEKASSQCLSKSRFLVEKEPLSWKEHFIRQSDGKGGWVNTACGHLYSTSLKDGSILTGFGNYLSGVKLIKWKP